MPERCPKGNIAEKCSAGWGGLGLAEEHALVVAVYPVAYLAGGQAQLAGQGPIGAPVHGDHEVPLGLFQGEAGPVAGLGEQGGGGPVGAEPAVGGHLLP